MTAEERQKFWEIVASMWWQPTAVGYVWSCREMGNDAIIMAMGDIANVLSEDAIDADNLTLKPAWIKHATTAQLANLSLGMMHAEMDFIKDN